MNKASWIIFIALIVIAILIVVSQVNAIIKTPDHIDFDKAKSLKGELTIKDKDNSTLAVYNVLSHDDVCLIDCEVTGTANISNNAALFDSMTIKDKDNASIIRNYVVYINTQFNETSTHIDLSSSCSNVLLGNGTIMQNCTITQTGNSSVTNTYHRWVVYDGKKLDGFVEWKLKIKKRATETIDWIPIAQGFALDKWAFASAGWTRYKNVTIITGADAIQDKSTFSINITNIEPAPANCTAFRWVNDSGDELSLDNSTTCSIATNKSVYGQFEGSAIAANTAVNYTFWWNNPTALGSANTNNKSRVHWAYDGFEYAGQNGTDIQSVTGSNWTCEGVTSYPQIGETNSTTASWMSGNYMLVTRSNANFGSCYRGSSYSTSGQIDNVTLSVVSVQMTYTNWIGFLVRTQGTNTGQNGRWLSPDGWNMMDAEQTPYAGRVFASGTAPAGGQFDGDNWTFSALGSNYDLGTDNGTAHGTNDTRAGAVGLQLMNGQVAFWDEFIADRNYSTMPTYTVGRTMILSTTVTPEVRIQSIVFNESSPKTYSTNLKINMSFNITGINSNLGTVQCDYNDGTLRNVTASVVANISGSCIISNQQVANFTIKVWGNNTNGDINSTESGKINISQASATITPSINSVSVVYPNTQNITTTISNSEQSPSLSINGSSKTLNQTFSNGVMRDWVANISVGATNNWTPSSAILKFNVTQLTSSPTLSIDSVSVIYGNTQNITASTTNSEQSYTTLGLKINGSVINALNISTIYGASRDWNATLLVPATQNYSFTSATLKFNVTQASTNVDLLLNSTRANISLGRGNYGNLSANATSTEGVVDIQVNLTSNGTGTSPFSIGNYNFTAEGYSYNITAIYQATQNYSFNSETWYVVMTDTTSPNVTLIIATPNSTTQNQFVEINATVLDSSGIDSVIAMVTFPNGTIANYTSSLIGSIYTNRSSNTQLKGQHNVTIWANDSSGNINNTAQVKFNITEDTSGVSGGGGGSGGSYISKQYRAEQARLAEEHDGTALVLTSLYSRIKYSSNPRLWFAVIGVIGLPLGYNRIKKKPSIVLVISGIALVIAIAFPDIIPQIVGWF